LGESPCSPNRGSRATTVVKAVFVLPGGHKSTDREVRAGVEPAGHHFESWPCSLSGSASRTRLRMINNLEARTRHPHGGWSPLSATRAGICHASPRRLDTGQGGRPQRAGWPADQSCARTSPRCRISGPPDARLRRDKAPPAGQRPGELDSVGASPTKPTSFRTALLWSAAAGRHARRWATSPSLIAVRRADERRSQTPSGRRGADGMPSCRRRHDDSRRPPPELRFARDVADRAISSRACRSSRTPLPATCSCPTKSRRPSPVPSASLVGRRPNSEHLVLLQNRRPGARCMRGMPLCPAANVTSFYTGTALPRTEEERRPAWGSRRR